MDNKWHSVRQYLKHLWLARRGGHGVHSPLAFALCEDVFYNQDPFYDFEKLKKIRQQLQSDRSTVHCESFGAGSRIFAGTERRIGDLASKGISSIYQSETLYRLANFLQARSCIELGTSLGLNSLYLALQNPAGKVFTVEGSTSLSAFARKLSETNGIDNIEYINADFDSALPGLIQRAEGTTLVYIDGDHSYEATLRYFYSLLPLAKNKNVFVFDDIYWSSGMTKAWQEIQGHEAVRLSIDTYYSGYLFFAEEIREKVSYRLWV